MTDQSSDTAEHPSLSLLTSYHFRFYLLVTCLLAVVGWGGYCYYLETVYGLGLTGDRVPNAWGVNIIDFVFFIAISMAGTIVSGLLRLSNVEWRKPITRIAETITIAALPVGALYPLLDLGQPGRANNLFFFTRLQSPIAWDMIALTTYGVASVIYFLLPLIPDMAICRDSLHHISKVRKWLYKTLSLGWKGTADQEHRLQSSIYIMALLVVPIAVCVHSVLAWVFAVTLRPDLHSTLFPIFFVVGAVYSGLAMMLVVIIAFRRAYHLEPYIQMKHILYLVYLFLATDLLMIYLTVTEYLTAGWTAETADISYITSLLTGVYWPYFWFMILGGFLVPAALMAIPRLRTTRFVVIASVFALAGMWVERYLIVVPSLAVPELPYPVGSFIPSWEDISITAAGFAGFILIMVLISRLVPVISLWEIHEGEGTTGMELGRLQRAGYIGASLPASTDAGQASAPSTSAKTEGSGSEPPPHPPKGVSV